MEWVVYDKSGNERCRTRKVEYNGTWMGECLLMATFSSPAPIDFSIGDYIVYRGETFTLNYVPEILKRGSEGCSGDAFTYEDVVFDSCSKELVQCSFLDYVPADNEEHYSSLPVFSFYAKDVSALAGRIQANLDRLYSGERKWTVVCNTQNFDVSEINISVSNINVWDALGYVNSMFKGTFTVKGRTITIGPDEVAIPGIFKYGKGNGLKNITRSTDRDKAIVTRLRAYGSNRNLPIHYYSEPSDWRVETTAHNVGYTSDGYGGTDAVSFNAGIPNLFNYANGEWVQEDYIRGCSVKIKGAVYDAQIAYNNMVTIFRNPAPGINDNDPVELVSGFNKRNIPYQYKTALDVKLPASMAVNNLMLPGFPDSTLDPHIDSENISELGIREGVLFFDGSDERLGDIYPSIEGMTAQDLIEAGMECSVDSGDNGHLDEVYSAEQIQDEGIDTETMPGINEITVTDDVEVSTSFPANRIRRIILDGAYPASGLASGREYKMEATGDFAIKFHFEQESANDGLFIFRLIVKDMNGNQTGKSVWMEIPILGASELDYTYSFDVFQFSLGSDSNGCSLSMEAEGQNCAFQMEMSGPVRYGKDVSAQFQITLKDIGFDINEQLTGEDPVISMKSGKCEGREFKILTGTKRPYKNGNKWVLTCEREYDEGLGLYFPYKDYNIEPGDKFVLTGIYMPKAYVDAASQRLLEAAEKQLEKLCRVTYSFAPEVDNIFMARQHDNAPKGTSLHDTLKEGGILRIQDSDMAVDGLFTIDSLVIKEGNSLIPEYEITLKEEKDETTLQSIQNQINVSANGYGNVSFAALVNYLNTYFVRKGDYTEPVPDVDASVIPHVAYQELDSLTDPISDPGLYLMDFGDSLPVVCGILEVSTTWGMNCVSQKLTGGFHAEDLNGSAEIPTMYSMELHTFVRHMNLSLKPSEWTQWEEYVPDSMDEFLKAVEWPGAVISTFTVTPQGLLDPTGGEVALAVKKGDASLGGEGDEPQGFVLLKGGKVYSVWLEGGGIPSSEYYNAGQEYSGTAAIEWPDGTVYVATGEPWTDLDGWNIGTGLDITHVDRREKAVYIASDGALKKVYGESDVIPRYVEWPGIVADSSVKIMSESVYPSSDSTVALQLGSNGNPWRFLLKTGTVFYNNWAAGTGIDGAIPPATDYQFNGSFLPNTIYRGRGDTLDLLPEGVSLLPECVFFTDSQCAMHKLWQKDEDAEAPVEWKVREWPGGVAEVTSVEPQSVAQPTGEVVLGTTGGVPDGFVLWQDGKFYNNWLDGDGIHGRAYYQEGVIGSAEFFDCTFYTATGAASRIVNPGAGAITRQAAVYVKDGESGELKKVFANAGGTGGVASIKVGNNEDSLQPDGNGQVAIPLATGTQDGAMSAGEKKSVSKLRDTGYTATMGDPSADATTLKLPNTGYYEDINTHEWAEDKQTITLPAATEEKAGVMSAADKQYLNSIKGTIEDWGVSPSTDKILVRPYQANSDRGNDATTAFEIPAATEDSAGVMSSTDKKKLNYTPGTFYFGDLVNSGMQAGNAVDWSYFGNNITSYTMFRLALMVNSAFYARIKTPNASDDYTSNVPVTVCYNEEDFIEISIIYNDYGLHLYNLVIGPEGTIVEVHNENISKLLKQQTTVIDVSPFVGPYSGTLSAEQLAPLKETLTTGNNPLFGTRSNMTFPLFVHAVNASQFELSWTETSFRIGSTSAQLYNYIRCCTVNMNTGMFTSTAYKTDTMQGETEI